MFFPPRFLRQVEALSVTSKVFFFIVADEPRSAIKVLFSQHGCLYTVRHQEGGSGRGCKRAKSPLLPHQADSSLKEQKKRKRKRNDSYLSRFPPPCRSGMANLSFFGLHPRLLQRLDLGLSPPAVSESAAVDLSFEIAAGAESRAGLLLAAAARPGSGCAEQPGSRSEVEHQRRGDPGRCSREDGSCEKRQSGATARGGRGATHSRCVRVWLWW